jgi:hypothetical protein
MVSLILAWLLINKSIECFLAIIMRHQGRTIYDLHPVPCPKLP